jgi:hypothetical protein
MAIYRTWDELSHQQRLRLYNQGSERVPPGWTPPDRSKPMHPTVTVDLSRTDLPEDDLWVVLWLGWLAQKIKPTEVTFYFNGHRVGSVKVPPPPENSRHVIKRSRVIFQAPVSTPSPVPHRVSTPAPVPPDPSLITCEHCGKTVTAQGYRRFHGVKCWRAP